MKQMITPKKTKKSLLLCNFFDSFLMYKATCTKSILESKNYIMELWKKSTTCKKKLLLWLIPVLPGSRVFWPEPKFPMKLIFQES